MQLLRKKFRNKMVTCKAVRICLFFRKDCKLCLKSFRGKRNLNRHARESHRRHFKCANFLSLKDKVNVKLSACLAVYIIRIHALLKRPFHLKKLKGQHTEESCNLISDPQKETRWCQSYRWT